MATLQAAFLAFARSPADFALIEVGMGGRLDATVTTRGRLFLHEKQRPRRAKLFVPQPQRQSPSFSGGAGGTSGGNGTVARGTAGGRRSAERSKIATKKPPESQASDGKKRRASASGAPSAGGNVVAATRAFFGLETSSKRAKTSRVAP